MKAVKATVTIGHLTIDGYRTDDGIFGMSMAGVTALCSIPSSNSTYAIKRNKYIKQLAAQGFETYAGIKCEGFSVTLIALDWVPSILQCLARSGNDGAWEILSVFAGLSLQQLFCDAFGEKFETAERQAWLQARYGAIEKRNEWTDSIKLYSETHEVSENWKRFIYANVSDRLNIALTGHKAAYWVAQFGCTSGTLRENWNFRHLSNIDSIEKHATILVLRGREPMDALNAAIEFFDYEVDPAPQKTVSAAAEYKRKRRAAGLAN